VYILLKSQIKSSWMPRFHVPEAVNKNCN